MCVVGTGISGRLRVLWCILLLHRPSVVVLQKLLYGRAMLRLLTWGSRTLIWECDDALHVGFYTDSPAALARTRRLIGLTLSRVSVVTTPNPLLASELRPLNGHTVVLPGPSPAWPQLSRPMIRSLWLRQSFNRALLRPVR